MNVRYHVGPVPHHFQMGAVQDPAGSSLATPNDGSFHTDAESWGEFQVRCLATPQFVPFRFAPVLPLSLLRGGLSC